MKIQFLFLIIIDTSQKVFCGKNHLIKQFCFCIYKQHFLLFPATEYSPACPNINKELGQGTWSDDKYIERFGSTDNQPWNLIANDQSTVNCCDENGGCIRIGEKIGRVLNFNYFQKDS